MGPRNIVSTEQKFEMKGSGFSVADQKPTGLVLNSPEAQTLENVATAYFDQSKIPVSEASACPNGTILLFGRCEDAASVFVGKGDGKKGKKGREPKPEEKTAVPDAPPVVALPAASPSVPVAASLQDLVNRYDPAKPGSVQILREHLQRNHRVPAMKAIARVGFGPDFNVVRSHLTRTNAVIALLEKAPPPAVAVIKAQVVPAEFDRNIAVAHRMIAAHPPVAPAASGGDGRPGIPKEEPKVPKAPKPKKPGDRMVEGIQNPTFQAALEKLIPEVIPPAEAPEGWPARARASVEAVLVDIGANPPGPKQNSVAYYQQRMQEVAGGIKAAYGRIQAAKSSTQESARDRQTAAIIEVQRLEELYRGYTLVVATQLAIASDLEGGVKFFEDSMVGLRIAVFARETSRAFSREKLTKEEVRRRALADPDLDRFIQYLDTYRDYPLPPRTFV